ncbi:MAG TPA: hypothetical protein PK263_04420, partial [bacterium]|nr:hypothetical protein [bacterium]
MSEQEPSIEERRAAVVHAVKANMDVWAQYLARTPRFGFTSVEGAKNHLLKVQAAAESSGISKLEWAEQQMEEVQRGYEADIRTAPPPNLTQEEIQALLVKASPPSLSESQTAVQEVADKEKMAEISEKISSGAYDGAGHLPNGSDPAETGDPSSARQRFTEVVEMDEASPEFIRLLHAADIYWFPYSSPPHSEYTPYRLRFLLDDQSEFMNRSMEEILEIMDGDDLEERWQELEEKRREEAAVSPADGSGAPETPGNSGPPAAPAPSGPNLPPLADSGGVLPPPPGPSAPDAGMEDEPLEHELRFREIMVLPETFPDFQRLLLAAHVHKIEGHDLPPFMLAGERSSLGRDYLEKVVKTDYLPIMELFDHYNQTELEVRRDRLEEGIRFLGEVSAVTAGTDDELKSELGSCISSFIANNLQADRRREVEEWMDGQVTRPGLYEICDHLAPDEKYELAQSWKSWRPPSPDASEASLEEKVQTVREIMIAEITGLQGDDAYYFVDFFDDDVKMIVGKKRWKALPRIHFNNPEPLLDALKPEELVEMQRRWPIYREKRRLGKRAEPLCRSTSRRVREILEPKKGWGRRWDILKVIESDLETARQRIEAAEAELERENRGERPADSRYRRERPPRGREPQPQGGGADGGEPPGPTPPGQVDLSWMEAAGGGQRADSEKSDDRRAFHERLLRDNMFSTFIAATVEGGLSKVDDMAVHDLIELEKRYSKIQKIVSISASLLLTQILARTKGIAGAEDRSSELARRVQERVFKKISEDPTVLDRLKENISPTGLLEEGEDFSASLQELNGEIRKLEQEQSSLLERKKKLAKEIKGMGYNYAPPRDKAEAVFYGMIDGIKERVRPLLDKPAVRTLVGIIDINPVKRWNIEQELSTLGQKIEQTSSNLDQLRDEGNSIIAKNLDITTYLDRELGVSNQIVREIENEYLPQLLERGRKNDKEALVRALAIIGEQGVSLGKYLTGQGYRGNRLSEEERVLESGLDRIIRNIPEEIKGLRGDHVEVGKMVDFLSQIMRIDRLRDPLRSQLYKILRDTPDDTDSDRRTRQITNFIISRLNL